MPEFDTRVWHKEGSNLLGATNIKVQVNGHHKVIFDKSVIKKIMLLVDEV